MPFQHNFYVFASHLSVISIVFLEFMFTIDISNVSGYNFSTIELGDDFDIREFHDSVIGAGSLPLIILERQVDQYISAFKSKSVQRP